MFFFFDFLQSFLHFFLKASVLEVVCALYGDCTSLLLAVKLANTWRASWFTVLFLNVQAMDHLESFIAECDRRTELAKKRLAETQEEISAEVSAKVSSSR